VLINLDEALSWNQRCITRLDEYRHRLDTDAAAVGNPEAAATMEVLLELRSALADVPALVAELRAAREELQRPAEERAARTMVYAQRFADQILDEAKVKAKAMVAEAETRARNIVEVAQERAFEIAREAR
jgi:vacuolar-type H+-ATPase subunit H